MNKRKVKEYFEGQYAAYGCEKNYWFLFHFKKSENKVVKIFRQYISKTHNKNKNKTVYLIRFKKKKKGEQVSISGLTKAKF